MKLRMVYYWLVFFITLIILNPNITTDPNPLDSSSKSLDNASNYDPGSNDALKSKRIADKLRKIKKGEFGNTENPSALIDAFRQIKTTPTGQTYESNYRHKELRKALKRRKISLKKANPLSWMERGPGNVSGRSRALLVDPDDETGNTWFVATVGGGVWKTSDAGINWVNKTPELTTLSTVCMVMAKSNPNVIYVGTGMGYGRTVDLAGNGVWKSTDKGETWINLESTANGELLPAINRIIVDPNDENLVLVCSNGDYTSNGPNDGSRESGIFRSTDGGETWTQVYDPEPFFGFNTDNRIQQIIANPNNFNEIYGAVNEIGVIKSEDGGITWFTVADNFSDSRDIGYGEGTYQGISTRTELAIAPSDPSRIYASVERRRGISKLFMSKDSGLSWDEVIDTGNNPNWFSYNGADGANSYTGGWFNNTIVVHPYDEDIVFVGGIEIYKIKVETREFTRETNVIAPIGTLHVDHHFLVTIPVNESTGEFRILNANDGGVGISNNGGNNWKQINGLESTQFYGVDKMPGTDKYIGGTQDNGTWVSPQNANLSSNWSHEIGGDGFEVVWNHWDSDLLIGCSQNGNYRRSTNGGQSWSSIPDARAGSNAPFISKIGNSKADPELLFTVGIDGVKRSDDFGASWTFTPISNHWLGWRGFDNVEVSIADPQIVWISSRMNYESFIGKQGGIHVSKDGGLSFTEISDNFPPTVIEASGISTDPFDPATAYFLFSAAGQPKILRTNDYGESFEDLTGFSGLPKTANESPNGFPDVAVYQVLIMPFNTDIIWAGTEIGLFISEDNGTTWSIADNGLPNVGIFQMSIVDDQVLVATYGRGIWTATLPELNNYSPPDVTLVPRLGPLAQNTSGDIKINIELRSGYDSTLISINGERAIKLNNNVMPKDTTVYYSVLEKTVLLADVISYKSGREYRTPERRIVAEPVTAIASYSSDFNATGANDFISNSAGIKIYEGFDDAALHFPHPYPNESELTAKLKNPIKIASDNSIMSFDEIVLVEEGLSSHYIETNFFDYVIVEGTKDGLNWEPLVDGYDSRREADWLTRYNSRIVNQNSLAAADKSLFRKRTINLLETFEPEDLIFIRFRLHSDPLAFGWGWVIDNLNIQSDITDTTGGNTIPNTITLSQNYPNPFNPATKIQYSIPVVALSSVEVRITLTIFDILGEEVAILVNEDQGAGNYEVTWNLYADRSNISSGIYLYSLEVGNRVKTKKMIYMK